MLELELPAFGGRSSGRSRGRGEGGNDRRDGKRSRGRRKRSRVKLVIWVILLNGFARLRAGLCCVVLEQLRDSFLHRARSCNCWCRFRWGCRRNFCFRSLCCAVHRAAAETRE